MLGLVPGIGEEDPELVDGPFRQQVLEDFGSVRLDEAEVRRTGTVGVEHRAREACTEDLDGQEVALG